MNLNHTNLCIVFARDQNLATWFNVIIQSVRLDGTTGNVLGFHNNHQVNGCAQIANSLHIHRWLNIIP
ncbi:hypothetical protein Glove_277g45 [Diversispora epigaea]|uniref:Uncharacterized protein n=1 Tax=Diversispora epigaea TaxID=1348612 RepID=A0A397I8Z5_9GLOM|nr:hypothetical protein Glove_277g45 [Diversispora epigaea]